MKLHQQEPRCPLTHAFHTSSFFHWEGSTCFSSTCWCCGGGVHVSQAKSESLTHHLFQGTWFLGGRLPRPAQGDRSWSFMWGLGCWVWIRDIMPWGVRIAPWCGLKLGAEEGGTVLLGRRTDCCPPSVPLCLAPLNSVAFFPLTSSGLAPWPKSLLVYVCSAIVCLKRIYYRKIQAYRKR